MILAVHVGSRVLIPLLTSVIGQIFRNLFHPVAIQIIDRRALAHEQIRIFILQ